MSDWEKVAIALNQVLEAASLLEKTEAARFDDNKKAISDLRTIANGRLTDWYYELQEEVET